MLDTLSKQVLNFYKMKMDIKSIEEWLILILVATVDKAPTLQEIFKRMDELKN